MARKSKYTADQRAALQKARQKKQEKYWEDRAQSRVLATDRQTDAIQKDSDHAYRDARNAVRGEIDKFYRDFATAAGISEEEARKKLSRGELQDFKKELARKRKIIQEMIQQDPPNRKLQAYDTEFEKLSKVRELTRKEALEANVSAEIVKLGGKQERQLNARSQNVVRTALWMNSADLAMLGDVDTKLGVGHPEQVKRAAKENWQHGDFSDKIWDDKEKLIREAREVIEGGFVRNKGAYDMAGDLMTRMNVSHSNALRLVRTEFNHLSNQAALAEYQAKGIKKYKFVSAIDSRTCDVCADLNGKVFNVADAKTGLNFPPMHPNCRSVTTPVIDWDDEDEWDYSGIELDDDELKKLGLTDEDVSAIDADTPMVTSAPALSLSVQQANQATEDTQSVQRRAEQAKAVKQQGEDIEIKARNLYDKDIGNIFDDIDRHEKWNRDLYADGSRMTPKQAAIEAENLDRTCTDILKAELEAEKLQARAAKIDESIPKPDPKRAADLEAEIERQKDARKTRRESDLPDDEVIAKATPKAFDLPEADASDAIEPRTTFGKMWMKVRDGVDRLKERFDAWLYDYRRSARTLRNVMNVSMVMPGFPYGVNAQGDMPRTEAIKLVDEITKRRKEKQGGKLFSAEEAALIERWHKSHPERNPESVIAVRMVDKRPVVVDRAGLTHMMENHHDYLVRVFDLEENIVDGLLELLATGQKGDRQRNYHKKGDSSPRIVYKGEWHGKAIAVSINVDDNDRLFGVNEPPNNEAHNY